MTDAWTTPEEDAADYSITAAIKEVAKKHKPESFMLTLGVLFAQGLALCPEKDRDEALTEFVYRIKKYCGLKLEVGQSAA